MSGLPAGLAGMRMVQITDLHIGPQLRGPRLARFVERVNRLDPDLIAITGDSFECIHIDGAPLYWLGIEDPGWSPAFRTWRAWH